MKKSHFENQIVCSREEYNVLRDILAKNGVVLAWSSTNGNEFTCYVVNPNKIAVDGWGDELVKKIAAERYEFYSR